MVESYIDVLKRNGIIDCQGHSRDQNFCYTCYDCGISSITKVPVVTCIHCGSHHLRFWSSYNNVKKTIRIRKTGIL